MRYTTITDLAAAVRDARPDAAATGVEITNEHVLAARHEADVRYEDIDDDAFAGIVERAVELALADAEPRIEVELKSPVGPRVLYVDGVDAEEVESALPEGWAADFSSQVRTDTGRFSVPLYRPCQCGTATGVRCEGAADGTVVEWMPEDLRASHQAAGNAGSWPHNGSLRLEVNSSCAADLLAGDEDEDGEAETWCRIVEQP